MRYKLRAECNNDIEQFINVLPEDEFIAYQTYPDTNGLPDTEAIIELRSFSLTEVINYITLVPDSHVMLQTVALEKDYTGVRNYDL